MTINLFGWENAFPQEGSDPDYEEDTGKLDIPIHTFDVIIADEYHRGYTAKVTAIWRSVLEHFDALKIGLTATPASHTIAFFQDVIYRYTTEQAIQDGYLVDYEAVRVKSDVRIKGVFLKPGEHVGIVDTDTGEEIYDELEDEREFPSEEIEKKITAPESNRKIIKEIAKYAYQHEKETGRFPKILIFAANDLPHTSHADQIVQTCRNEFGQGDDFVQKITGSPSVDRPLQKIREFRNRPKPKVVVTVDMLSTGVDIPSLEFIIFLRPVKSRILWVQMVGRGTRLCSEINKSHFKIFDCFDGTLIEYFRDTNYDFKFEPPQKEPVSLEQVIENIYQNIDREYNVRVLVRRLRRIERDMSGEAREQFANYIPDGDIGKFASELRDRVNRDFTATIKLYVI
jgi:type I restriction enzyme R subunit